MRGWPGNWRDIGYKIERTSKGWELAGVPERVLHEFSKRSEQVEQKSKELGVTTAKEKDGLAALTRERKQKQISKAELRDLWERRVSPAERLAIHAPFAVRYPLRRELRMQRRWILRFGIATNGRLSSATRNCSVRRFAMASATWTWKRSKRQLLAGDFIKEQANGREWFTTNEVLAEEQRLIKFVQNGRGKVPCVPRNRTISKTRSFPTSSAMRCLMFCEARTGSLPFAVARELAKRR